MHLTSLTCLPRSGWTISISGARWVASSSSVIRLMAAAVRISSFHSLICTTGHYIYYLPRLTLPPGINPSN